MGGEGGGVALCPNPIWKVPRTESGNETLGEGGGVGKVECFQTKGEGRLGAEWSNRRTGCTLLTIYSCLISQTVAFLQLHYTSSDPQPPATHTQHLSIDNSLRSLYYL